MDASITNLQKQKIKELVDEIIVNRGILNIPMNAIDVDGMRFDDLYRLAFKYYKMIVKGESPLDIDRFGVSKKSAINADEVIELYRCIGCNNPLNEEDISNRMPVCESCRKWVRVDFEILRELFH